MTEAAPQHKRSLLLASMVAWLSMPVGYALFVVFVEFGQQDRSQDSSLLPVLATILGYGLTISGIAMFLFGLRLVIWLRSRGWLSAIPVCFGASVIGALTTQLFVWFMEGNGLDMAVILISAGFGASSGVIFSVVAGLRWGFRHP